MSKQVTKGGAKKDRCYNEVKRRYKVFPSAYASGMIAKCRKGTALKPGGAKKKYSSGTKYKYRKTKVT